MSKLLPIEARDLIRRASAAVGVTENELLSPNRSDKMARARFAVMLTLRNMGWSYPRIAAALHRKDHTTVIHGVDQARKLRCSNPAFIELLDKLSTPPWIAADINRFVPGITDQGPPRAAKGGFPYPGHGTLTAERSAA